MNKIGLFYGSDTGNTEIVAEQIQKEFGKEKLEIFDVANAEADDIDAFDILIFGASTQGIGDTQYDFEEFLEKIENKDLTNKTIAIFGLGDGETYPDTFVDAIGTIYEAVKEKGAKIIGKVQPDGYIFEDSTALINNTFIGLPIDEDNQDDLTEERIKKWVAQLKNEIN